MTVNKASGYISLHRQIKDWEWYKDTNTKALFIHLLISANYADTRFLGKKIKRGQLVTSLNSLAFETGLSIQSVRTAIKHLISTGEITEISTMKCRIITVVKYDEYQMLTNTLTDSQQSANKELTNSQQHHNNNNNNSIREKGNKSVCGATHFTPPTIQQVIDYCKERKNNVDPERFIDYYESNGWMVGKNKMKSWQAAVRNWEKGDNGGNNRRSQASTDNKKSKWDDLPGILHLG